MSILFCIRSFFSSNQGRNVLEDVVLSKQLLWSSKIPTLSGSEVLSQFVFLAYMPVRSDPHFENNPKWLGWVWWQNLAEVAHRFPSKCLSCEKQSRSQVAEKDPGRDRPRDRSRERASEREKKDTWQLSPPALRAASRQAEEGDACHSSEGKGRDPRQPPSILGQQLQTQRKKLAPFHRDVICTTRSSQEDSVLIG